ncbi:interferon-induced GTP-binding protein Mx-like protein [Corchorus capsularis]|uniref:Interferon-induced GTP-binding protein Mx-like protein n=1 Tax=Corchorus capsularis TaxID=210143 RepID=A0A1R3HD96_COCAP|nr:interferon-induced GTP-binding protein Mx-like protein [Corchorus capsularis]
MAPINEKKATAKQTEPRPVTKNEKERRRELYREKRAALRIEEAKYMAEEDPEIEGTVEEEMPETQADKETATEKDTANSVAYLRDAEIRFLHMVVGNIIDCRNSSVSSVTHKDIWIMHLAMTGQKFNTAKYIIAKMKLIAKNADSTKHPPAYGNIIIALFEEKGLWNGRYKDSCKFVKVVPLDTTSLKRMHYAPGGPTWKKKNGKEARENDADMWINMLEETMQTLTKRLEVVEEEVIVLKKIVKGKEAENNENGEEAAGETEHADGHVEVAGKDRALVVYTPPTAGNRIEEIDEEDAAASLRSMAHSTAKTKTKVTKPHQRTKKINPTSSNTTTKQQNNCVYKRRYTLSRRLLETPPQMSLKWPS